MSLHVHCLVVLYICTNFHEVLSGHEIFVVVVVVVLLFYIHGKHLWSCRDGQLTWPQFSCTGLDLLSG